jgi:hypothetical protein
VSLFASPRRSRAQHCSANRNPARSD